MKFQILIPTYNRCIDLKKNLEYLKKEILKYQLAQEFAIAVSDNASTDDTWAMLQQIKNEWKDEVQLDIVKNEANVGLEQNVVNLLQNATAEYLIWLGDDDFLAEGYLAFIQQQFANTKLGWMIPGLTEIDKQGNQNGGRPVEFSFKHFSAGFSTVYELSHFAHQMSGLVVKREKLAETYLAKPEWRNPYLFIFFTAYCQLFSEGVYAPSYRTIINNFNPKDWGYNKIGLLDEVFKSYYYLKETIGQEKLNRLLLRFVIMHSYRIDFSKGMRYVLQQGKWIINNASGTNGLKPRLYKTLIKEYLVRKFR